MHGFIWYDKLKRPAPGIQLAPKNGGGLVFINREQIDEIQSIQCNAMQTDFQDLFSSIDELVPPLQIRNSSVFVIRSRFWLHDYLLRWRFIITFHKCVLFTVLELLLECCFSLLCQQFNNLTTIFSFFAAALSKAVIDILEDDKGLENEFVKYWMQIQLKEVISSTRMNAPRAFAMPEHLKVPALKIKEWHKKTKRKFYLRY